MVIKGSARFGSHRTSLFDTDFRITESRAIQQPKGGAKIADPSLSARCTALLYFLWKTQVFIESAGRLTL
jgi:hypothetical protein